MYVLWNDLGFLQVCVSSVVGLLVGFGLPYLGVDRGIASLAGHIVFGLIITVWDLSVRIQTVKAMEEPFYKILWPDRGGFAAFIHSFLLGIVWLPFIIFYFLKWAK